jgi:hypothetical protein
VPVEEEKLAAFVAGLHSTTLLVSRGVLNHPELGPTPAVLTYNSVYGQDWVWAFTQRRKGKGKPVGMENHVPGLDYVAGPGG